MKIIYSNLGCKDRNQTGMDGKRSVGSVRSPVEMVDADHGGII